MKHLIVRLAFGLLLGTSSVSANEAFSVHSSENIDDAMFSLTNAIVAQGLVIDYEGHPGAMLARTSEATGGSSPYVDARYVQFCSAQLTMAAVSADPANMAICPFVIYAYTLKGEDGTVIGYRSPPNMDTGSEDSQQALADIQQLLQDIIEDAVE